MHRPVVIRLTCLGLMLVLAACSKPTRDDPIRATNDQSFEDWIDARRSVLSETDIRELNEARQLIRFRTMEAHRGMSSAEQAREVYAEMNGRKINDVLATGYALQVERVRVELANYKPVVERFQGYKANPNLPPDARKDVEAKLAKLDQLIRQKQEELDRLTKRLNELKQGGAGPSA